MNQKKGAIGPFPYSTFAVYAVIICQLPEDVKDLKSICKKLTRTFLYQNLF